MADKRRGAVVEGQAMVVEARSWLDDIDEVLVENTVTRKRRTKKRTTKPAERKN